MTSLRNCKLTKERTMSMFIHVRKGFTVGVGRTDVSSIEDIGLLVARVNDLLRESPKPIRYGVSTSEDKVVITKYKNSSNELHTYDTSTESYEFSYTPVPDESITVIYDYEKFESFKNLEEVLSCYDTVSRRD